MSKRIINPQEEDGEELELLRQQAKYFKEKTEGKTTLAAKFIASTQAPNQADLPQLDTNPTKDNIQEQIANTFEAIPTDMTLPEITEKQNIQKNRREFKFASKGFPQVTRRDPNVMPAKGSIFSQQITRCKAEEPMDTSDGSLVVKERQPKGDIHSSSGESVDSAQIHAQNINILNQMSEEEKLAEREKLLGSMDPALIQFLRDQRAKKSTEPSTKTIQEQNRAAPVTLEQVQVANEILQRPDSENWLNFHQLEASKLAWTHSAPRKHLKLDLYDARFDFNGYLLQFRSLLTEENRHLFHHGDDPDRPGYTLQELLRLARSYQSQQRILALNTLANLLNLEKTGTYARVLVIPMEQVFFVVRVCLDENAPPVLNAALKAMRNLVCFQLDETCLDSLMSFGMVGMCQPVLEVEDADEGIGLNDQQLAEKDLVGCLVRTDILVRIRYIINTIKPPLELIAYCFDILVRLARDKSAINKIFEEQNLIESLLRHFLPKTIINTYELPLPQMVKLLRILAARGPDLAKLLEEKYHVTDVIVGYLYEETFGQNSFGMLLQVESMRFLTVMAHQGLYKNSSEDIFKRLLHHHFDNTDNSMTSTLIRQSHMSALFNLLSALVENGAFVNDPVVTSCFSKWIGQFKGFEEYKCDHSQLVSSLLHFASVCEKRGVATGLDPLVESLFGSRGFDEAVEYITHGSMFLNDYKMYKSSSNLACLASTALLTDRTIIVPVLQPDSCIPLLYCLSCYILQSTSTKLKLTFLTHSKIREYVDTMARSKRYFNAGNWFSRCESHLIMNILRIAVPICDSVAADLRLYYAVAFRCVCVFGADQLESVQFVLNRVVFCRRFFDVEVILAHSRLDNALRDELDSAWTSLDDIKEVYADVLGLKGDSRSARVVLSLVTNSTNAIPLDWIYSPLIRLYSADEKKRPKERAVPRTILNCLRWILMCETYSGDLTSALNETEKYVRLCCVFLCSDDLFLNEEIERLLGRIMSGLREPKMNFRTSISGSLDFNYFYCRLLGQYRDVSYGNKVFANALLFPLVKRHGEWLRKRLWSDFLGVVETCTLKCDEVWLDPRKLIYPADTDPSIRKAYGVALKTGAAKSGTIMHAIAVASAPKKD